MLARDADALQFRADTRLNAVIRETARARPGRVMLMDVEETVARAASTAGGVPGSEWFHEHVHLNFDGDYFVATHLLPEVAKALRLDQPHPLPAPASRAECAEALGFTSWEETSVAQGMVASVGRAPFLDQLDHDQRQAAAMAAVEQRARQVRVPEAVPQVRAAYAKAKAARPEDWAIQFNFGMFLLETRDPAAAAQELGGAVKRMPHFLPARIALTQACWDSGRRDEARRQIEETLRLDPEYAPALEAAKQLGRSR